MEKNLIFDKRKLKQIIKRMAYEIYEQNYKERELVIAGVEDRGYTFAKLLVKDLSVFPDIKISLIKISLNKTAKIQPEVFVDIDLASLKNKSVVVADDVLNTGRALIFSLAPFLSIPLSSLKTAVIIDRNHKKFPVSTDFAGYSLATTLKEHIEVIFEGKEAGVYIKD
jgi:pyrimidine operon attenuation protein/uracil phosphoribosyltransferase